VHICIACDFDGTITTVDTAELTLKKFAAGKWEVFDDLLGQGKISLEDCMINQFRLIKAPKEEIIQMLDSVVSLRPKIEELIEFCRVKDIEFTILSAGLDFYIDHVISKYGWNNVKRTSGTTTFTENGISIEFPKNHFSDSETFKEDFVRTQKGMDKDVWYFGDGTSDREGALTANMVFTVTGSRLSEIMEARGKIHRDFQDFGDILTTLKNSLA
jgi:2-hydroxy-3-keto-5-methylthiopentenyl-1-phosphate phosphatase